MKDDKIKKEITFLCEASRKFLAKCEDEMYVFIMSEDLSAEEQLQREVFLELLDHINGILRIEEYGKKSIVKTGTLSRGDDGEILLNGDALPLMAELEVYIYDELRGQEIWARTFVGGSEKNYLVGLGKEYDLNGISARIRG